MGVFKARSWRPGDFTTPSNVLFCDWDCPKTEHAQPGTGSPGLHAVSQSLPSPSLCWIPLSTPSPHLLADIRSMALLLLFCMSKLRLSNVKEIWLPC